MKRITTSKKANIPVFAAIKVAKYSPAFMGEDESRATFEAEDIYPVFQLSKRIEW